MEFFEILTVFIVLVPILFLAYATTRFVAGRSAKAMNGRYIHIVETVSLGGEKRLHAVKAGDKYLLIASTSKSVEYLTDIPLEEADALRDGEDSPETPFDFKGLIEKYVRGNKDKKQFKPDSDGGEGITEDAEREPSIRRNIKRLRAITGSMEGQGRHNGDE